MKQVLMSPSRRRFLRDVTGASVAVLGAGARSSEAAEASGLEPARPTPAPAGKKFIAIQVGAVSFADEGVEKVLDVLQERGRVNALMLAVFTCAAGEATWAESVNVAVAALPSATSVQSPVLLL